MSNGSTTVRINQDALEVVKQLAAKTDANIQTTLERAIEDYRRKILFNEANAAYQELKHSNEWKEELEEREIWDVALLDHQ